MFKRKRKIDVIKTELGIELVHPDKRIIMEKIPDISPQFIMFLAMMIMFLSLIIMFVRML